MILASVCLLGVVYIAGTFHGLWLAWTQEAKCRRWAYKAADVWEKTHPDKEVTS